MYHSNAHLFPMTFRSTSSYLPTNQHQYLDDIFIFVSSKIDAGIYHYFRDKYNSNILRLKGWFIELILPLLRKY